MNWRQTQSGRSACRKSPSKRRSSPSTTSHPPSLSPLFRVRLTRRWAMASSMYSILAFQSSICEANCGAHQIEKSACRCGSAEQGMRFPRAMSVSDQTADSMMIDRTRKIKEVDFGFSLGFGPPAEESSQSVAQPTNSILDSAPVSQAPLLEAPPPPESTTTKPPQTQSTSSPPRTNPSSQNQPVRRTPGSARNKLPPRPSTFDIPAEEEPELERTSKRRKIGWLLQSGL